MMMMMMMMNCKVHCATIFSYNLLSKEIACRAVFVIVSGLDGLEVEGEAGQMVGWIYIPIFYQTVDSSSHALVRSQTNRNQWTGYLLYGMDLSQTNYVSPNQGLEKSPFILGQLVRDKWKLLVACMCILEHSVWLWSDAIKIVLVSPNQ